MKYAIVGAGAIGAFLGARLAMAGEDVWLIARGAHLEAMRRHGVRVRGPEGDYEAFPKATDDPAEVGVVDYAFLTVKAHSVPEMAPKLAPLLGPETAVVSAQNGIPWWYFHRHGGALEGTRLQTLDPTGAIAQAIEARRIIGCVVYPSTVIVEPGVIQHIEGNRFTIGELDGSKTDRGRLLSGALIRAGLKCPISTRIRRDLWVKLMGSVAFNPLSALTRATLVEIATDLGTSALARAIMEEADQVARALGIEIPISIEQRLAGAAKVGRHKTSTLQDLESGKQMELESIVGAVVELGDKLGVPVELTRSVYACARLLNRCATKASAGRGLQG